MTPIPEIFKLIISAYNKKCPGQRFSESLLSISAGKFSIFRQKIVQISNLAAKILNSP